MSSSDLELFEVELLKEFPKTTITSAAGYKDNIIIGDSQGNITNYKREKTKLVQNNQIQLKSKIEKLIAIPSLNVLFVLSGGNLTFYDIMSFNMLSPKESDKEFKDVLKVAENRNINDEKEIIIVNKKKKLLFLTYLVEISRLTNKGFKDKDGNPLSLNLDEIPERIKWNGNHVCYSTKSGRIFFLTLKIKKNKDSKDIQETKENKETPEKVCEIVESCQNFPAENIVYINNSWVIVMGNVALYFDLQGQAMTKNTLVFNENLLVDLKALNDIHIVALSQSNIGIYENNEGQLMQTLNIDNNLPEFKKIFLAQGENSVFVFTSNKKDEKSKEYIYKLWEVREYTFEKQIKIAIKSNQIEKAFNILNSKLEYNEEKFKFLESFYCDCGWNFMEKRTEEGYNYAEIYFGLCNFNPYELIYHFIKLLKIKPIHEGFQDEKKLPLEVDNCQIFCDIKNLDIETTAALQMLIKVLLTKKNYILQNNLIVKSGKEKGKKKTFKSVKNNILTFESSQNCPINLQDVQPTDIKLFETINIINEVLVNAMVLLGYQTSFIEEIIEDDKQTDNFSEEFFKYISNFTSEMALACIYKKSKKYSEAFKLLERYINDMENSQQNLQAVNLLKKILIGFGTNLEYSFLFERGIKILLPNHSNIAFEIILYNELIEIDDVLKNILPESKDPDENYKREMFLKIICDDKHYSNEKYQTLYIELLIKNLFSQKQDKDIPKDKESEDFPKEYSDLKKLMKKYDKYDASHLLYLVQNTWMYDVEIYLLSQSKKNDEALKILLNLEKSKIKTFEDIREFCKINYSNDIEIFKKYFQKLREQYDDKENKDTQLLYKKEMLKIIDLFINGELLDEEEAKNKNKLELLNILNPKEIISLIPTDWKLNEPLDETQKDKGNNRTIFNLMHFYLKEYTIINNNYKRLESLAKMDLTYKQKQLFELRDKHIALDVSSCCYLCGKKIVNNTPLMIYPNGHIYHAKCSPDMHLEIKTGKNFKNFDY